MLVGLTWAQFCCWAHWVPFSIKKICIMVYIVYLHTIYHFISVWGGRNGWMAMDGLDNSFPIRQVLGLGFVAGLVRLGFSQ